MTLNLFPADAVPPDAVRVDARVARTFEGTDWSFATLSSDPSFDIHPYPARYIGAIPAAALDFAPPEGLVVDPFCGVGTTLVEAVRRRRPSVGVDLNPIATLVSRAKLSGWTASDAALLAEHRAGVLEAIVVGDAAVLAWAQETIPRLDHWFAPEAQAAIAGAVGYISALERTDPWKLRLQAALSSILVRASRQESDTRYAAIEKDGGVDALSGWLSAALDRVARACSRLMATGDPASATVHTADASDLAALLPQDEPVGLSVFSPPYPNAYEYWLYHKYRMYWLGYDPIAVRSQELGARPFYSGSGKMTASDFARQMFPVFRTLAERLLRDGSVIVVVGDSIIRGEHVDNAELLGDVARDAGLVLEGRAWRDIRRTRRSFNLAVARAKQEHVLRFVRD